MATKLEIMNAALMQVGASVLTAEDQPSNEGNIVRAYYDTASRGVWTYRPWSVSLIWREMTGGTAEDSVEGWYVFSPPDPSFPGREIVGVHDVFEWKSIEIGQTARWHDAWPHNKRLEWTLRSANRLVTTAQQCQVVWQEMPDEANWPHPIADAIIWRIASDICLPLTNNDARTAQLWQFYQVKLQAAAEWDAAQTIRGEQTQAGTVVGRWSQ